MGEHGIVLQLQFENLNLGVLWISRKNFFVSKVDVVSHGGYRRGSSFGSFRGGK